MYRRQTSILLAVTWTNQNWVIIRIPVSVKKNFMYAYDYFYAKLTPAYVFWIFFFFFIFFCFWSWTVALQNWHLPTIAFLWAAWFYSHLVDHYKSFQNLVAVQNQCDRQVQIVNFVDPFLWALPWLNASTWH